MKATGLAFILLIIFMALTPFHTHATSLRCGVRLITEGEVWEEERVYGYRRHPGYYGIYDNYEYYQPESEYGEPYRIKKLVIVERWTYNHGPGRFMDHLRLENGVVKDITSGEYGY